MRSEVHIAHVRLKPKIFLANGHRTKSTVQLNYNHSKIFGQVSCQEFIQKSLIHHSKLKKGNAFK